MTRWLDSITDSMDVNVSKPRETVKDREAWCAAAHGVTKSWILLSDGTTTNNECLMNHHPFQCKVKNVEKKTL